MPDIQLLSSEGPSDLHNQELFHVVLNVSEYSPPQVLSTTSNSG